MCRGSLPPHTSTAASNGQLVGLYGRNTTNTTTTYYNGLNASEQNQYPAITYTCLEADPFIKLLQYQARGMGIEPPNPMSRGVFLVRTLPKAPAPAVEPKKPLKRLAARFFQLSGPAPTPGSGVPIWLRESGDGMLESPRNSVMFFLRLA